MDLAEQNLRKDVAKLKKGTVIRCFFTKGYPQGFLGEFSELTDSGIILNNNGSFVPLGFLFMTRIMIYGLNKVILKE